MKERRGYQVGGLAAIAAAVLRLSIAGAYAATSLGAAGDRSFGSFSGLTFVPSALLVVSTSGLHGAFSGRLELRGRLGLFTLGAGFLLTTVGQFGGEWLSFPRSGNWLILPGTLLATIGLVVFALGSRSESGVPTRYRALALLIALLPLAFVPISLSVEAFRGRSVFPPTLHDNYFRALYALGAILWLWLGVVLLRDARTTSHSAGPAR